MGTHIKIGKITLIKGNNRGNYPFCHSLFLEEDGILVDPASDYASIKKLADYGAVAAIWLSHWHEDHFAFLSLFPATTPVRIAAEDAPPLESINNLLAFYGVETDADCIYWEKAIREQFAYQEREIKHLLPVNEEVILKSDTVKIIPTPGHTPGHIALHFQEHNALFVGDYDLTSFGPWYGDRDSSIEQTVESIGRLRAIPVELLLTSHGQGLILRDEAEQLWDNYLSVIHHREEKILNAMDKPLTLAQLASKWLIYGKQREPLAFFTFGERALLKKHLENMLARGLIVMVAHDRFQRC